MALKRHRPSRTTLEPKTLESNKSDHQMACCEAEHIIGYQTLQRFRESKWLASILKVWQEAVGWQQWQQQQGGEKRFQHFRVFFDDAGCVDVIARSCDIEEERAHSPEFSGGEVQ